MKFAGNHWNKDGKMRLTLFYEMMYNFTPLYLSSLVPETVSNISHYGLRNSNDLQTIASSSSQYYHSFRPSTTRDWNSLSTESKQSDSVNSFTRFLNKGKSTVPNHYYIGSRKAQILHTRIRTNCSSLNLDLFLKSVTDSPLCRCGSIENAQNFFFHCRYYNVQSRELMTVGSLYANPSLNLLLTGGLTLSPEINNIITLKVQKYIIDTNVFEEYLYPNTCDLLVVKDYCQKRNIPISLRPISHILQVCVFLSFLFFYSLLLFCSVDEIFFYSFNEVLVICVSVKVFARS